jgi:hypothetical protein
MAPDAPKGHSFNISTVAKVRQSIAELLGTVPGELAQGLGHVIVTTAAAAPGDSYSARYVTVLQSLAANDPFRAMLAERRAVLQRAIERIGDVGDGAIARHRNRQCWTMILRDVSAPGSWRTQSFDFHGFSGHESFATRELAVEHAAKSGFTERDDRALDRLQDTETFQRGLYASDLVRQHNIGELTLEELHRRLAVFDETSAALRSISNAAAAAFWAPGSDTVYMLADRIQEGTEQAVYLHEIMHKRGRSTLGAYGWNRLTQAVKAWQHAPGASVERLIHFVAHARAAKAVGTANTVLYEEELFAYAVEEAVRRGVKPSAQAAEGGAQAWLAQVEATLRAVIEQISGAAPAALSAQQMVDLSYALAQLENPARAPLIMESLGPQLQQIQQFVARGAHPLWYSPLLEHVASLTERSQTPADWMRWLSGLKRRGVSPHEIEWSGLTEWLEIQKGKVAKHAVLDYLQANGVQVQEVVKGEAGVTAERDRITVELTALGYAWRQIDGGSGIQLIRRSDRRYFDYDAGLDGFVNADDEEDVLEDEGATELGRQLDVLIGHGGDYTDDEVPGATKYERYTLPGGESYREVLLTLPQRLGEPMSYADWLAKYYPERGKRPSEEFLRETFAAAHKEGGNRRVVAESYKSSHWSEPNILAHIRLSDRTDADGKKVLFVDEIQSDWAQDGRRMGFVKDKAAAIAAVAVFERDVVPAAGGWNALSTEQAAQYQRLVDAKNSAVPSAPFVEKTDAWLNLALKRVIKMAADGGYDRVAFVSGQQSADRYNLSKQVVAIEWNDYGAGKLVTLTPKNRSYVELKVKPGGVISEARGPGAGEFDRKPLEDVVGKETAAKIMVERSGDLRGLDLKVGGHGMLAFYDEVLPRIARNVVRKLGGAGMRRVRLPNMQASASQNDGAGSLGRSGALREVASMPCEAAQLGFDINEAMRVSAAHGMPLFSLAQVAARLPSWPDADESEAQVQSEAARAEAG